MSDKIYNILVTRLPYAEHYDPAILLSQIQKVEARGLICISMPLHIENPSNGARLICQLQDSGLFLVSMVAWMRDRHIVTTRSRRLTNTWEPLAIFGRVSDYVINREAATKIKKGYEGKENSFDEEDFSTCIGDYWPIRNDRRDRRFLPFGAVLNCCQLGDLQPGDVVFDPYGNPGIKDSCRLLGWKYVDGGLENPARNFKGEIDEDSDVSGERSENKGEGSPVDL